MKKLVIISLFLMLFSACGTYVPPLYNWGLYEHSYYQYYKTQTPASYVQLYTAYSTLVASPGGSRATIPPGICAEYGYLLLAPETSEILINYYSNPDNFPRKVRKEMEGTDWNQVFAPEVLRQKGMEMLQMEVELYPESATFINPLIQKFSHQ